MTTTTPTDPAAGGDPAAGRGAPRTAFTPTRLTPTRLTPTALTPTALTWIALAWVAAYGVLRAHRAAADAPGGDLAVFTGWAGTALCGAAAAVLLALALVRPGRAATRVLAPAAWTGAACLAAAGAPLLVDVIGTVLPGLGIPVDPPEAARRAGCVAAGVLTGLSARAHTARARAAAGTAAADGRSGAARTPRWAYAAAYLAVTGCLVRVAAQAAVGLGEAPLARGASAVLFDTGYLLGGIVLPLALVHPFGRTWPRRVPGLGGRRVPRRLVLWPAAAVSGGLTAYFGTMLVLMAWERLHGRNPFPPEGGLDLPEAFFWVAVPAYLVWGAGMAAAARAYARRTRGH